ncbi:MAG: hypothetical protein PVG60_03945, partial [Desulfarculaceae bacterium]
MGLLTRFKHSALGEYIRANKCRSWQCKRLICYMLASPAIGACGGGAPSKHQTSHEAKGRTDESSKPDATVEPKTGTKPGSYKEFIALRSDQEILTYLDDLLVSDEKETLMILESCAYHSNKEIRKAAIRIAADGYLSAHPNESHVVHNTLNKLRNNVHGEDFSTALSRLFIDHYYRTPDNKTIHRGKYMYDTEALYLSNLGDFYLRLFTIYTILFHPKLDHTELIEYAKKSLELVLAYTIRLLHEENKISNEDFISLNKSLAQMLREESIEINKLDVLEMLRALGYTGILLEVNDIISTWEKPEPGYRTSFINFLRDVGDDESYSLLNKLLSDERFSDSSDKFD